MSKHNDPAPASSKPVTSSVPDTHRLTLNGKALDESRKRKTQIEEKNDALLLSKRRRITLHYAGVNKDSHFGCVVNLRDNFGFIRTINKSQTSQNGQCEPSESQARPIYFSMKCYSGLFELALNDEVSYIVRQKESNCYAINVRLIKCSVRTPYDIDLYVRLVLQKAKSLCETEQLVGAISNIAVWQCIGNCIDFTNNDSMSRLVRLLLQLHEIKILKNNFSDSLEALLRSDVFKHSKGHFINYVQRLAAGGPTCELKDVRQLIFIMTKLLPNQSKLVVALVSPMVSQEQDACENFLYRLLRQVTKDSDKSNENLDWNELPLAPSVEELSSSELDIYGTLRPVAVDGPYPSAEDYLDIYFRLLRVDCFSTLRKGVTGLLQGTLDPRDMNVYFGVELAGIHINNKGRPLSIGLRISSQPGVAIDKSSQLMFGNLVCISVSGTFRDSIWATVVNRELLKTDKIVFVELCSEINSETDCKAVLALHFTGSRTVVAESPTYYRAYEPVLRSLQLLCPHNLVFQEELVHCHSESSPAYIKADTDFDGTVLYTNQQTRLNAVCYSMDESQVGSTTLDASQEEAIKCCLRHRVSIIQGPPGTGKTYVGIKLAQLILSMSSRPPTPILVVTYKNHALDEFLRGMLNVCNFEIDLARVGGRSKDVNLNRYNLSELHKAHKMRGDAYDHLKQYKFELDNMANALDLALKELNKLTRFSVEMFQECLNDDQLFVFLQRCDWYSAKTEHFSSARKNGNAQSMTAGNKYVREKDVSDFIKRYRRQFATEVAELTDELRHLLHGALRLWLPTTADFNDFESDYLPCAAYKRSCEAANLPLNTADESDFDPDRDETQKERMSSSSAMLKSAQELLKSVYAYPNLQGGHSHMLKVARDVSKNCSCSFLLSGRNIWKLAVRERIQVIQCVLYDKYEKTSDLLQKQLTDYENVLRKKEELEDIHKAEILRKMQVVGMTVTGASINKGIIEQLKPAVILVEEAAEIIESQLIAVMGPWTQHLILIGDHKQLRPSVEDHRLASEYHLDISMMERLINNGLPHSTLSMQNRMRPEFADLLLDIYPGLQSNMAVVGHNEQPRCVQRSMFFWDRRQSEMSDRSFTNPDEANCAINLALFLVEQGYKPRQITILAPYLGQVRMLRSIVRKHGLVFSDEGHDISDSSMQVQTIDTYQGDENDFVIVSLVRSNPKGSIGFLTQLGRRCVAQSRARRGLYFVGNRETLSRHQKWRALIDAMDKKGCVGTDLPLICPDHPLQTQLRATGAEDIPLNQPFCQVKCNSGFPCNVHVCEKTCQPKHLHSVCKHRVSFTCMACGCLRNKECWEDESKLPCTALIKMMFSSCGHMAYRKCNQSENDVKCKQKCSRLLTCSHPCDKMCSVKCDASSCKVCIQILLVEAQQRRKDEEQKILEVKKQAKIELEELRKQNIKGSVHRYNLSAVGDTAAEFSSIGDHVRRFVQRFKTRWQPTVLKVEKIINLKLEIEWLRCKSIMFDPTRVEQKLYHSDQRSAESILSRGIKWITQHHWTVNNYLSNEIADCAEDWTPHKSDVLIIFDVLIGRSKAVDNPNHYLTRKQLKLDAYDSLYVKKRSTRVDMVMQDGFIVYDSRQAIPRYLVHFEALDCRARICPCEQQAMTLTEITHHHIQKPKRSCDMDELELHFRTVESQFLRLASRRKLSVESIDYYLNPPLLRNFYATQAAFRNKYGMDSEESKYILAFHGTSEKNIRNIVATNFDISRLSQSTGSLGKYGAGIYFSEFPEFSMAYGKSGKLLLCRILPGKSFDCPDLMMGASLHDGFDSHRAKADSEGRGLELVIFNADQILPCYVINYY